MSFIAAYCKMIEVIGINTRSAYKTHGFYNSQNSIILILPFKINFCHPRDNKYDMRHKSALLLNNFSGFKVNVYPVFFHDLQFLRAQQLEHG